MLCKQFETTFIDVLSAGMIPDQDAELSAHLGACRSCCERARGLTETWESLGRIPYPEPSTLSMRRIRESIREMSPDHRVGWARFAPLLVAASLAGLMLGFGAAGRLATSPDYEARLATLEAEAGVLRNLVTQALDPRVTRRLRLAAISATRYGDDPATTVALIATLRTDPNVGIRLASASALESREAESAAAAEIGTALIEEPSAHVQLALLRLLSRTDSPGHMIRAFLARDDIETAVRAEAVSTLAVMDEEAVL